MLPPAGFRSIPLTPAQLKLDTVLRCGQSFLWHVYPLTASSATSTLSPPSSSIDPSSSPTEPTHEYRLCLPDRLVCLRQSPSHLFYRAVFPPSSSSSSSNSLPESEADSTLAWLTSYFQLPIDLPALYARWSSTDPAFARLSSRPALAGIRVLRQDPWECLLSFICSQNNHISRITKLVHALPEEYSDVLVEHDHPLGGEQVAYRPFPGPEALASPEVEPRLRELGFGYRAKYIQGTAAALVARASGTKHTPREWLGALRLLPLPEARAALLALPGVGPKVADCVLLMSLDQPGVVPVDTHVLQIAVRHYGLRAGKGKGMTPALYAAIGERFAQVWGEYAGWAQGVVFAGDLREFAGGEEVKEAEVKVGAESGLALPPSPASASEDTPSRPRRRAPLSPLKTPTKRQRTNIPPTPESLPPSGKRKRDYFADAFEKVEVKVRVVERVEDLEVGLEGASAGERVKLRRRGRGA